MDSDGLGDTCRCPIVGTARIPPLPELMLQSGIGTRVTFRPDRAAQLLVLNAMKSDVDSAISWLADLLENARIGTARSAALAAHGRDGDDTDQTHRTDPVFIVAALTL
jgi:hypothetical protein